MSTKRYWLGLVLAVGCMMVLAGSALAQKSGGGGGGNAGGGAGGRHGGNFNINWDFIQPFENHLPKCVGSEHVTTYVTTLSVDIRMSNLYLADNTVLTITVYAKDYFSGAPWTPKVAGTMAVNAHSATFATTELWTTAAGGLPVVTAVVVTLPDGTIVASGH